MDDHSFNYILQKLSAIFRDAFAPALCRRRGPRDEAIKQSFRPWRCAGLIVKCGEQLLRVLEPFEQAVNYSLFNVGCWDVRRRIALSGLLNC